MPIALPILDAPHRPDFARGPRSLESVRLLRLSLTDRCNLRCLYCMPDEGVRWMTGRQADLLAPADYEAVARAAMRPFDDSPHRPGVTHLKLTGGEPTLRPDLLEIVARLADLAPPTDLSLTTNGTLLARLAKPLRSAGLDRITISLDSLDPDRFAAITRGGDLASVKDGIRAATDAGFTRLKLNVVVIPGWNDDEIPALAALSLDNPWTIRFIEYMPLGDSAFTLPAADPGAMTLDNAIVRARIASHHCPHSGLEPISPTDEPGVGPATLWRIPGARGRLGFISAMSRPFCESCNRLRLTALGELRSCLFDGGEVSLLPALRPTPDHDHLVALMRRCVALKPSVHSDHGNRPMNQIGG